VINTLSHVESSYLHILPGPDSSIGSRTLGTSCPFHRHHSIGYHLRLYPESCGSAQPNGQSPRSAAGHLAEPRQTDSKSPESAAAPRSRARRASAGCRPPAGGKRRTAVACRVTTLGGSNRRRATCAAPRSACLDDR